MQIFAIFGVSNRTGGKILKKVLPARFVLAYAYLYGGVAYMKTIYEVVKITGLSRRVIQEYENAGLAIKPINKNKYGHLLYGTEELERLWQLRFYKELGYDKAKIRSVMENSVYDRQKEMEKVVESLIDKREKLDNLIAIAQVMQETGVCFNSLKSVAIEDDNLCFDDIFNILGTAFNISQPTADKDYNFENKLTEEDIDTITTLFEQIMKLCEIGKALCSEEVQSIIESMHEVVAKIFSRSILIFRWITLCLAPDSEVAADIDTDYGEGKAAYFYNALQYYCSINADNKIDKELINAIENIEKLGRKKYRTDSAEVQLEVKKIHHFFSKIDILSEKAKLDTLKNIGVLCGSKAYINAVDNGARRGISWFISRSIQIFCNNLEKNL